jgi:hypothetical protein
VNLFEYEFLALIYPFYRLVKAGMIVFKFEEDNLVIHLTGLTVVAALKHNAECTPQSKML